jgi:vacuolar-type H+-ATPase subunit E/Vma4
VDVKSRQLAAYSQMAEVPPARKQLEMKRDYLESELKRVNDALDAITAHPEIEKVFELIRWAL